MPGNISNQTGRALEYKIIEALSAKQASFDVVLTERARRDQGRDVQKFETLSAEMKSDYEKCSKIIHDWLWGMLKKKDILIDRLTDDDAKRGDVTDIRIKAGPRTVNLSVKHNHSALKHQRPPTTVNHCGYPKGSSEDVEFRANLDKVISDFQDKAKTLIPDVKLFNELDKKEAKFIDNNLYKPVCLLVTSAINELCRDVQHSQHLFEFLVGNCSYYKIIDYADCVNILDFCRVGLPNSVTATMIDNSHVLLVFDTSWEINMRLHTASSKFGKSLKFDSQPVKIPEVEEIVIKK